MLFRFASYFISCALDFGAKIISRSRRVCNAIASFRRLELESKSGLAFFCGTRFWRCFPTTLVWVAATTTTTTATTTTVQYHYQHSCSGYDDDDKLPCCRVQGQEEDFENAPAMWSWMLPLPLSLPLSLPPMWMNNAGDSQVRVRVLAGRWRGSPGITGSEDRALSAYRYVGQFRFTTG